MYMAENLNVQFHNHTYMKYFRITVYNQISDQVGLQSITIYIESPIFIIYKLRVQWICVGTGLN